MANNICPKPGCTNLRHENRPYCLEHGREWAKLKQRRQPQVVTEEQWQRALARARERHAERTPEERAAYLAKRGEQRRKWLDSDPAIRQRHNVKAIAKRATWSPERREREREKGKGHYQRRQERAAQGLCEYSMHCVESPIGKQSRCLFHWCVGVRFAHTLRVKPEFTAKDLVALWHRQGGKCQITGVELIPGENTALDHIVPVILGGDGTISNLRFVDSIFNRAKWNLSDQDLRAVVLKTFPQIIEWAKKES